MPAEIGEKAIKTNPLNQYQAKQIMTKSLLAAKQDWSVAELAEFLVSSGITGAPVVNSQEQLIGVVSVTDIARHASLNSDVESPNSGRDYYINNLDFDHEHSLFEEMEPSAMGETQVHEIMTPTVFDVAADTSVNEVSKAMIQNKIHRVFVSENKKVIGVISALDVLNLVTD